MKKFIKKFIDVLAFCLGLGSKTETGKEAERLGLCDFSGQGREKNRQRQGCGKMIIIIIALYFFGELLKHN